MGLHRKAGPFMRFHRWEGLSKAPDPSGWRREPDMCAHIGRRLPPNLCVRSKWQRTPDVSAHIGSALPTLRVRLLTSRENAWHGSVCDRRLTTRALTSGLPCHSSTLDVITRAEISLGQGWASPSGSPPPEACPFPSLTPGSLGRSQHFSTKPPAGGRLRKGSQKGALAGAPSVARRGLP